MPPPPQLHIMICGLSVGLGPCSERGRADLPYRSGDGARRHLCAVTASPACQRFPGRELPSPMLTARQPDELSVSSNSPHTSHSTAPPGRSHCFAFHRALLLYSALDVYLSSFSIGTWQPQYLADHLTKNISAEDCRNQWKVIPHRLAGDNYGHTEFCVQDIASVWCLIAASQHQNRDSDCRTGHIFA